MINRLFTIKGDKRRRTLTIRAYKEGKLREKYRTIPLSQDIFKFFTEYATQKDILSLLKSDKYYEIKDLKKQEL